MSRQVACVVALIGFAFTPATALAAAPTIIDLPPPQATAPDAMAAARAMTYRRTRADCVAEAVVSTDILVCAPLQDQALPVPEIYGPVAGSTDGAAVDPSGVPCTTGPHGCYSGVDLPKVAAALVGIAGLLIDPDRNLGEGEAIPERFRGANR